MNNWDKTRLAELGEFRNGANYPKGSYGIGDKIVNVKDLFKGRFISLENLVELKPDALKNKKLYLTQHGDLLFTRSSLVKSGAGMVAMMNEPENDILFCGFIIRFRPNFKKVNPLYLLYLLRSPSYRKLFTDGSVQTNISNINQDTLGNIELFLPKLSDQNSIINIIDLFDTKIELNNKINRELEAMAKMLYDYWFVQFDFPNEQGKPYKSSGGNMVYNADLKREIPEGWEVKNIFKCSKVQYGFPFSKEYFNTDGTGVPVIRIRDILENSISNFSTEKNIDNKYFIRKGDLLVGMDGNFHINYWSKEGCYLNQRAVKLSETILPNIYLKYQIEPFIKLREKSVSRTTVGHLSDKDLKALNILIPTKKVLDSITSTYKGVLDRIIQSQYESKQLSELRDWLLPMLMNGQVTVKESENFSMAAEPIIEYK